MLVRANYHPAITVERAAPASTESKRTLVVYWEVVNLVTACRT